MNRDDFVDRERIKLEAERVEIEAKIQHLGEWLKGEVDIDAEEGDPDLFEREKNLALLNTLERRLEQTISAMRAIDKGLYLSLIHIYLTASRQLLVQAGCQAW